MAFIVAGIILLLFVLMIYGLVQQSRARAAMTEEEWENRERETSLLGASVMGFDKILRPDLEKAAAVEEDQRQGMISGGERQELNIRSPGQPSAPEENRSQPPENKKFHFS
ncbi:MAG TPA: hypothetical protein VNQ79_02185 [Blastocatellia bacterium]|nr:hypothetical protein [Blastocatellia bacterium]